MKQLRELFFGQPSLLRLSGDGLPLGQDLPLPAIPPVALRGHKASPAGDGIKIAVLLQLGIGPLDGAWIHGELHGQTPHAGHFGQGLQTAAGNQPLQLLHHLFVDGALVPIV